jgi:anti-anti-sigma regulatory factor
MLVYYLSKKCVTTMSIITGPFKIADQPKECYLIKVSDTLKGPDANDLREKVADCVALGFETIYVDVKDVTDADLSGINEIINSHYTLHNEGKKLILLYKKNSVIEKWVETTGLDKFVVTAIVPAS